MFKPVNRYILVEEEKEEVRESLIVLPEDYQPSEERYTTVEVKEVAEDVRFKLLPSSKIVIDKSMMEEITIGATNYSVILDNYVVGIIS
jgi:co-chaperonin GroES (HSP10)